MLASNLGKLLYGLLFAHSAYWVYLGHWLYAWDQVLWIGGFFAIEPNVSDWRKEIDAHQGKDTPGLKAVAASNIKE